MADIFISYASEDRERVGRIADELETCGWSVWWDRKIVVGQAYDKTIESELEAAKCVIVLWSQKSIDSEWVKNEAAAAAERGVLVPALIDRVKLPLEFRRKQTADLVGWEGNTRQDGFQALCNGVAAKVAPGKSAAGGPPAVPQVHGSRQRFSWKWASLPAIAIFLGLVVYWVWVGTGNKTPTVVRDGGSSPAVVSKGAISSTVDLADMVAGIYHGDVISDSKGSSRSDVTLTITKLSQRKVRIASDYQRLGVVEIELNRVGNSIQSTGGRSLLLLELDKNPPRLNFNPDGGVAYVGQK